MKKILFIDHEFHKKTKSSDFFISILRIKYEINHIHVDPESPSSLIVLDDLLKGIDGVLIWQLDFIGSYFINLGIPTLIIPMYDGSSTLGDIHWECLKNANFINFSKSLHDKISSIGASSMLIKYYPETRSNIKKPSKDGFNIFFWERNPNEWLNIDFVLKIIQKLNVKSIHFHRAHDNSIVEHPIDLRQNKIKITYSRWFDSNEKYLKLLDNYDIFIAPRLSEGIGFSFLEAMALGKIVIANDMPTHSEYLHNFVNGILFNSSTESVDISHEEAEKISNNTILSVKNGRSLWNDSIPELFNFIDQTLSKKPKKSIISNVNCFSLLNMFNQGVSCYTEMLLSRSDFSETDSNNRNKKTKNEYHPKIAKKYMPDLIDPYLISLGNDGDINFKGEGWHKSENEWSWMNGLNAEINFNLDHLTMDKLEYNPIAIDLETRFVKKTNKSISLSILLNGKCIFFDKITFKWEKITIKVKNDIIRRNNNLIFITNFIETPEDNDNRSLSLAFKYVKLNIL